MRKSPGCKCCCKCAVTLTIEGCYAKPCTGVAYTIYDPRGNVVTSGTTSSSGEVTFTARRPGAYKITASKSRYVTLTSLTFLTLTAPCPSTSIPVVTLTPASGYACSLCCPDPLSTTLHLTDSLVGDVTLTYDAVAGYWSGSAVYAFPGRDVPFPCPPADVTVSYSFSNLGTGCGVVASFPTSAPFNCPDDVGTGDMGVCRIWTILDLGATLTCSPFSFSDTDGNNCFGGATMTLTE
jgi:hypothetical protein